MSAMEREIDSAGVLLTKENVNWKKSYNDNQSTQILLIPEKKK